MEPIAVRGSLRENLHHGDTKLHGAAQTELKADQRSDLNEVFLREPPWFSVPPW
jgi:hypothetical protein